MGTTVHVNDADTGLTYMQQRYYDPVAARFLSEDPVLTDANSGASFNRYAYANNNPYRYVDPDGRQLSEINERPTPNNNMQEGFRKYDPCANMVCFDGASKSKPKPIEPVINGNEYIDQATNTLNNLALEAIKTAGSGRGPVYGTAVHTIFGNLVKASGRKDFHVEQSFTLEGLISYGFSGSIRTDVILGSFADKPVAIYDLKTGSARLTQSRAANIRRHFEGFTGPIIGIYPQILGEKE